MNPSSQIKVNFSLNKSLIIFILGIIFLIPLIATAQEATEEPQVDTVVTEEVVEQPTEVVETPAPTEEAEEQPTQVEETQQPVEETDVAPEATPQPDATDETPVETETSPEEDVEPTDDPLAETTQEPDVEPVETEVATEDPDTVETEEATVEETPVEITEISEDFEAWTGEHWTVTDWSIAQVDNSQVLSSNVVDATAQLISLDWTNYSITVDVKVEAGNTLNLNFADYSLVIAPDGRNRLSQGDAVIATSPAQEVIDDTVTWHTVYVTQSGTTLAVTLDDIPQYIVETVNSPLGIFAFTATGDQGVAIDNLMMSELDEVPVVEVISTPTPAPGTVETDLLAETTEEPDLLAEVTEEPDLLAEATEEPGLLAETTEEPDLLAEVTEEPDLLAEATEEPAVSVGEESVEPTLIITNLITDDFESDLSAWATTASIVEVAEGNHVLLLSGDGQLAPANSLESQGVVFAGQANILNDGDTAGYFTIAFGTTHTVEIGTAGVTISESGEVVATTESALPVNTWFTFSIEANSNSIAVSINDALITDYTGELALDVNFVVSTSTSTMFEDVTVDALDTEEIIEPLATETPEVLTDDARNKLGGIAQNLMDAYLDGGDDAVSQLLSESGAPQDELGRVLVDILANDNFDGQTLAQLVTDAGGEVTRTHAKSIEAYVDVNTLIAVAGNEAVLFIRNINRAVSTGPVGTTAFGDDAWTEGFNLLSIQEWHLANVTGQDVKVGVIDTGFSGADDGGQRNGNLSCLASTTPVYTIGGLGTTDHGTEVIEVICDIAPDADVYMFRADSAATVQEAISAARNPSDRMDILIITLDLGANTSAGGGISGNVDANVYAEIEAAKNDGMTIIVAAGNNNKRTLVLEITGGAAATTITISNMDGGDVVKFGWNDFNNGGVVANIAASLQSGTSSSSNDPDLNPLAIQANGGVVDADLTLTITPSSINAPTYLQIQIVPTDATSDVQFDFGSISITNGSTVDITDTVGSLGRPADSDHVISVGAVCAHPGKNPTRWEFSSNGPRFNSDGTPFAVGWDTVITQDEAKPTLMSYSFVSTFDENADLDGNDPVDGLLTCTEGFGGTSAAAAHVAGMAALLMSNDTNASFGDLNEANATDSSTFNAIRDYLQARSVDLPLGANADGYDVDHGSGLSILGAPTYDLDDTINLSTEADLLPANCNAGNTYYVGQAAMDNGGLDGGIFTPFTSIAAAINAASPECVIVMPGEYVTPILVDQAYANPLLVTGYNDVSRTPTNDVIFWLRGQYFDDEGEFPYRSHTVAVTEVNYPRHAGLYFSKNSSNVEFSGFTFVVARIYSDSVPLTKTSNPQAVVMSGSMDTTISNSQFGAINLNGVDYPGWNFNDVSPVLVVSGTEGGVIKSNIFNDNTTETQNAYPTVAVIDSGTKAKPITVYGNEMYGNEMLGDRTTFKWGSVLYGEGSELDVVNNVFEDNYGETILRFVTTPPHVTVAGIDPTHDRRVRVVGNIFLNNTTRPNAADTAGPLINAHYTPMLYIINNTFVGNIVNSAGSGGDGFKALFARGNNGQNGSGGNGGSNPASWEFIEFHNNLVFDNEYSTLVTDTALSGLQCPRIPNINGDADLDAFGYGVSASGFNYGTAIDPTDIFRQRGMQNNWIESNTVSSGSEGGFCQTAMNDVDNNNIVDTDNQFVDIRSIDDSAEAQDGDFQGQSDDSLFTEDDWQYYALTQTRVDENPGTPPNVNEYSDGIDAGNNEWLKEFSDDTDDLYMDGIFNLDDTSRFVGLDIVETGRILNVNNWDMDYSLVPPQGISNSGSDTGRVDIGAFEFSPLNFETNATEGVIDYYDTDLLIDVNGVNIDPITDSLEEDNPDDTNQIVTFDFNPVVTGGFGDLTYTIVEQPENYGTQCGDQFENTKGLVQLGTGFEGIFQYCPPANFYTDAASDDYKFVGFILNVTDEANASTTGIVRFTIDPDPDDGVSPNDDSDFGAPGNNDIAIGDQLIDGVADESDLFEVVTTLGADINVRLRPYTRFGNFFFSENGNPEFVAADGKKLVDYPFTYTITAVSDPDNIIESTDFGALPANLFGNPVIGLSLSDSETGTATITYSVRDGRNEPSGGNILTIRSVSIVPDEGLHDDTSFIWNYSDGDNAEFYTELNGFDTADVPESGDWQAERKVGTINETLHTTSTEDDTATFRFIGTGFTIFMRGGTATGSPFALKVYDDIDSDANNFEVDVISGTWTAETANINKLEVDLVDDVNNNANLADDTFVCTTRAGIDTVDQSQLVHNLDEYTITCDGLPARTHSVQIINTGGGTLSVDAFSIINDASLTFDDAGPIPPGFHDVDNNVLRNAFGVEWNESVNTDFSNDLALEALVPVAQVSFTISDASGFAIGTTYRNNGSSFQICVNNDTTGVTGVCTIVDDNIGSTANGVRFPFFGLNPSDEYTITLTDITTGFIFDDLIVFNDLLAVIDNLTLGKSLYNSIDVVLGEPFGDDWIETDNKQTINTGRSPMGPFVAFQMDDDIDTIILEADNVVPPPPCSSKQQKKGQCPPAPPSGLSGLAVCVNRGNLADSNGTNFGNCIIIDTSSNEYDYIDSTDGDVEFGGAISAENGLITIPETLFDNGAGWSDTTNNIVEIFSLYPDPNIEFTSITLLSSALGLGEGTYSAFAPGFTYVQYDQTDNTYTEVQIDDVSGAFNSTDITQCLRFKKGNCLQLVVIGTKLETTGIGNAILFKMQGSGLIPSFTPSFNSMAKLCLVEDSGENTVNTIITAIQNNHDCQLLDLSTASHYLYGLDNTVAHHAMIELLPSLNSPSPSMSFNELGILNVDWTTLDALTPGTRYETSYQNRFDNNEFAYVDVWETKIDTDGTHSGSTYDETDGFAGAGVLFRTSGGNVVNIIRDLKTSTPEICTGRGKKRSCTPGINGFSPIEICIATVTNTTNRKCSVYSSAGDATQVALPISLNDNYQIDNYIVSITSVDSDGFVIDAVEIFDTTSDKMTVGIYEENSTLITYDAGQTEILKNTSFENSTNLLNTDLSEDWDWNISAGITATITTEQPFIGLQSVKVEADADEKITSEAFNLDQDYTYTVIARVFVSSTSVGHVEMDIPDVASFVIQESTLTDTWRLMRYSFVAASDIVDAQIEFTAKDGVTTFYIDDVHIYKGGSWTTGQGGYGDGQLTVSEGHGSKATFMFTGTGYTVKLGSDENSGEVQICHSDIPLTTTDCFTYDNQQELPAPPPCSKSQRKSGTCPQAPPATVDMGHTIIGLPNGDYMVTIRQVDNGLRTFEGASICTGSGKKQVCIPVPANSPNASPTTIKLDYVEIYDGSTPPEVVAGTYNEDAQFTGESGLLLLADDEWQQIFNSPTFSENSYYQVSNENIAGALAALLVDNSQPATVIFDINQPNINANRILVCGNEIAGSLEFNGTTFDLESDTCTLTSQATTQPKLVFNVNNIPDLDGSGGDTLLTLQSLTTDSITIDGYQVLYGTTLTEGYYEEFVGFGTTGPILTTSNISGTIDDWVSVGDPTFSGLNGLQTNLDNATIDFTFQGTGVSLLMRTPASPVGNVTIEVFNNSICGGDNLCTDEFDLSTANIDVINGAITIAGLPEETYDVRITANINEGLGEGIILDAIEVFGELQELGSLYDDAQVDVNGVPLLSFGPSQNFWTGTTGDTTGAFLNNTFHAASQVGASVSFEVNVPTEAIVIYDGNPIASSTNVEVCWSNVNGATLEQTCDTVNLNDGSTKTTVNAPAPGTYSISITNQADGEPLIIDAIQVLEEGLMTEGIYEEDFSQFLDDTASIVGNGNAGNGFAMRLDNGEDVTFTFEGVAFSATIIESSDNYEVCVYAGAEVVGCPSPEILDNITATANTLSAVSYGGFHNNDGSDNAEWTVVITNNDVSSPLLIDRVDILGNKNDLEITDSDVYEAGEPQLRYLPFGSWVEETEFKDDLPFNGNQFGTTLPGAIAYFEFSDDGSGTVGVEYIRQVQADIPQTQICVRFKKGKCKSFQIIPAQPPFADANICYGEVGDPSSSKCEHVDNDQATIFQFGSSTAPVIDQAPENIDCTNGCWGFIEYQRQGATDSKTTVDYIRLYDPDSTLSAGVYQENHPNIEDSGVTDPGIADENARVGLYDLISGTVGESYFAFPFEGTGLSIRTFAGPNAEDIDVCIIDYTGGAKPTLPGAIASANCLRTYENEQEENGFITHGVHGLHHGADYMAIIKMDSDGTTAMGLDQVTIFNQQWFTESDLSDGTHLKQLTGGNSYVIDLKTSSTDKFVQFIGDWQSINEQILIGYGNPKKKRDPIFETIKGDRGFGPGTTVLFRTGNANTTSYDIELGELGTFQICAIPMTNPPNAEVDLSENATCQTITQEGRALNSFIFSATTDPHVITIELLSDTYMSIYNVSLFDLTNGLGAGLYDNSAPGIQYDLSLETLLDESMEDEIVDWNTIGSSTVSERSEQIQVCVRFKKGTCASFAFQNEPAFDGTFSRKVTANIGQGIEYVGSGTGVALEDDTYYTVIAHVYIDPTTAGGVTMRLISGTSGTQIIDEIVGLDLSTTTRGKWQTIRADFETENQYDELILELVATNGQTTFFADKITITTGGEWGTAAVPVGPDICSGRGKKRVCTPGQPLFDALGGNYFRSFTPGASFTFDFAGTGFELGLIGGNTAGEVQVCYSNEPNFANPSCFTYSQDDGVLPLETFCARFKKGDCIANGQLVNDTTGLLGRGIAGLPQDEWTVVVREIDDGYNLSTLDESRQGTESVCVAFKKGSCTAFGLQPVFATALFGLDYLYIFDDTDIVTVPTGSYNEDAQNGSDMDYLAIYPEEDWATLTGNNGFSQGTYLSPLDNSAPSTIPGPVALLQVNVPVGNENTAVVFRFGTQTSGFAETILICVDETNGEMTWDGTEFGLINSTNCKLFNDVALIGQVSITSEDIVALQTSGPHNITITALTGGNFWIDGYQVFDSAILTVGLHNESLPSTILDFRPNTINTSDTCDRTSEWCFEKTKTVTEIVCTRFKKGKCKSQGPVEVSTNPYLGGAASTAQSGASLNFTAEGTGFSIISDVAANGLDFRVCYKLASSDTSFPVIGGSDETVALNGIDGSGLPVLISEGGVLCENLTTDTDNWDNIMDRPLSSGEQYGFSYYGLPNAIYAVQVTVVTPQNEITNDEWFTIDAINIFSNILTLDALESGITDNASSRISYEPAEFWDSNTTSSTYFNTDSTTDNAGAISQFRADGNTVVLYQTVGDMSTDVQICLIISNENIHCSVEAERQTRLANQVTNFSQAGATVETLVCTRFKKGSCRSFAFQQVQEVSVFTPVVFYGLGDDTTHKIIMENRVHGKVFNVDAIQVID